jgi:poly-gamma-glutamate synthesis protein (capsule biosynthesis protein)
MAQDINILFTGDFYSGPEISRLIDSRSFDDIFGDFLPYVRNSDIAVTNLEAPLTYSRDKIQKTGPALKSSPETVEALKYAGFNLITLSNNHIMDYGVDGLKDTLSSLSDAGIDYLGVGENLKQASGILYKKVKGKALAFINVSESEWSTLSVNLPGANPLNPVLNYYSIKEAKEKADYVFLIVHGGHERYSLPSLRMKQTYRFFIDVGADAIIGHHTHFISGYEYYKDKPIFYSLGNFIFENSENSDARWYNGIAVKIRLNETGIGHEIIPFVQNQNQPGLKLLSTLEKEAFNLEIQRLSNIIIDDSRLADEFEKYCQKSERLYNYYKEPHANRYIYYLQRIGLLPSFLNRKKRKLLLNLIRCESHRDVLLKVLDK